jgi:serine/threonine protein kinase
MANVLSQTLIGQRLMDQYLVLKSLETGGFSETYLALDIEQPETTGYLVKLLDIKQTAPIDFQTLKTCFDNEALALGQLNNSPAAPTVPQLIAYCRDRDQIYIIQEYIEGQRLDHWIESQPRLRLKEILSLLQEILSLLAQIHHQGIIHCDIKPSNLMRRRDGRLFLIDFGACRRPDKTHAELMLGTPGYMPKEQAQGNPQINSDIYALGMMMIQILTGISPQELDRVSISQEWDWQRHIPQALINLPLISIVDRMVQHRCQDRYPTAQAAIAELQTLMPPNRSSLRAWPAKPFSRNRKPIAPTQALKVLAY